MASAFFLNVILTMNSVVFSWMHGSKSNDQQKGRNRISKIVKIAV